MATNEPLDPMIASAANVLLEGMTGGQVSKEVLDMARQELIAAGVPESVVDDPASLGELGQGNDGPLREASPAHSPNQEAPNLWAESGDYFSVDSSEAMYDRQLAQQGSTVTERDISRAEMHTRYGNDVAADNVASGVGQLDETLERAEYQREADMETAMNAHPGESVTDTKERLAHENQGMVLPPEGESQVQDIISTLSGVFAAAGMSNVEQGENMNLERLNNITPLSTPNLAQGRGIEGPGGLG